MAQITTSLTSYGYQVLAEKGLVNTIKYYSLNDNNHLYSVTADNTIIPNVTGDHLQITNILCGQAKYSGMFADTPSQSEIKNARSRVLVKFNNVNCDDAFSVSNLQLQVNINPWLTELSNATYDYNMAESLSQILWDAVTAEVQQLDLTLNDYTVVNSVSNLKLSYVPNTEKDIINYKKLTQYWVDGTQKQLVISNTAGQYGSPFLFTLTTQNVNGSVVHGTSGLINMVPNTWGYWANGGFQSVSTVENSDLSQWQTIYPAVMIGSKYYYLPTNTAYNTANGSIGYLMNMVNVSDASETALDALVTRSILFMKTNGKLENGKYIIPITLKVNVASAETNNITEVIGNTVTVNFVYDPNDTTSPIVQQSN